MSAPAGRGRGRGSTLPAWMTRGSEAGVGNNNSGADDPRRHDRGPGGADRDRHRDERDSRAGDRGYEYSSRRDEYRDRDRERSYRDRDYRGGNDRGVRRSDDYPDRTTDPPQRGHRGLGYGERGSRGGRDDIPWERDRGGAGRGRGSGRADEMNFVRGEVINRDSEMIGMSMGRGRGRGRGANINQPAWMTSGPVGEHNGDESSLLSKPQKEKDNETMEQLLAQARQVQKEQTKRDDQRDVKNISKAPTTSSQKYDKKESKARELEKLQKQRQLEQEEAAKKAEDERKRMERLREEEEERQLRALVGDISEDEDMSEKKKRKNPNDDEGGMFQFETEEERDERLARKRREERRKKLRQLEPHAAPSPKADEDSMEVDKPRNAAGVIQSELNDIAGRQATIDATMEVENNQSNKDTANKENDSGEDSFDIFAADNSTPVPTKNAMATANSKRNTSNNAQECDDAEGYYKASIGEVITLPKERGERYQDIGDEEDGDGRMAKFRVLGIIGKGVFSSVIKCVEETTDPSTNGSDAPSGRIVAMKVIRNNEVMARAAAKEMRILRMLCRQRPKSSNKQSKKESGENGNDTTDNGDDEEDREERERRERENHNIVRLLDVDPTASSATSKNNQHSSLAYAAPPPEFRSHCIFLFEFLPFNLREVLSKFGKNVGINLTACRSYARQLLCALDHLRKHHVVHADIKPDNILVSANFSTVKLADFGSAFFETDHDNDPTPYLVSRFYRPPEVILGLEYDRNVDLWSTSVTLAELFTGSVLFPGRSNNEMLVRFMDAQGPLSHKMAKRHSLSYTRMGLQPHFEVGKTGGTYQLRKQDVDRVTGQPVCRLVNVLSAKADARLAQVLLRASKPLERVDVLKFADLLSRCLALDPARRLSVRDALRHEFFKKKKKPLDNKDEK